MPYNGNIDTELLLSSLACSSFYQAKSSCYLYEQKKIKTKDSEIIDIFAKGASTMLLATYSFLQADSYNAYFSLSLIFHSIGDVIIEIPDDKAIYYSMSVFFIGHVLNTNHLNQSIDINSKAEFALIITGIGLIGAIMGSYITLKSKPPVKYIIPFYACALTCMLMSASLQKNKQSYFALSAAFYILSDFMIGYHNFVEQIPINLSST
tara:strand:- start:26 stop:649 length:624 start_codon:yes stop_codon:yes gene_type:complete